MQRGVWGKDAAGAGGSEGAGWKWWLSVHVMR